MRIDQFVPAYHRGDAIGDEAAYLKSFFLTRGFESEVFCLTRDKGLEEESRLVGDFPTVGPTDMVIFHYALPSPLSDIFKGLPCRKVLIHHNITPPGFFEGYSQELVDIFKKGREELTSLVPVVDLALGDSEYNRRELEDLGFSRTEVFPLYINFDKYLRPENRFLYDYFKDGRTNILFVGRIVPNKKIEDLIRVVFYYKKYISPLVRLLIVGKTSSLPNYYECLVRLADEFYLKPEEICFTGHVTDGEMYALYKAADVFLSMSEHEGFALPLIESMLFDLPVIAYDSTAAPFTLDGAGILIRDKSVEYVGELIRIIMEKDELRERIILSQRDRLRRFLAVKSDSLLLDLLEEVRGR